MNSFELETFLTTRNIDNIEEFKQTLNNNSNVIAINYKGIITYRLK